MSIKKRETIRAFVALDLDTTSLRRVVRVADRLRMGSGAPSAIWTPAAWMHVTLKFMEELPADATVPLAKMLRPLADGKKAPRASRFRLSAFPRVEEARIIVALLEDPGSELARLATRVDKLTTRQGVKPEVRPFRPHVTLARLKRPYDARRWMKTELAEGAGECRGARLTLYRSDLESAGARYVELASYAFAAGG